MLPVVTAGDLNSLYGRYNRREYVSPDPLEFLYRYRHWRDREIVGLVASSLAYGRMAQILRSVESVLRVLGASPASYLSSTSSRLFRKALARFKHRFTTGEEVVLLLHGIKRAIEEYGSLRACFEVGMSRRDETVLPALGSFVEKVGAGFEERSSSVLPIPEKGSACKRLNLYLRWMIRRDEVDPGVWRGMTPDKLIVPLDTHMHRICRRIGFTRRKQANLRTALEITAAFREIAPGDPVRYDFALTRLGIRDDTDSGDFFDSLSARDEPVRRDHDVPEVVLHG